MNRLILWQDLNIFWGCVPRNISEHQHPIYQLVVGVNKPFQMKDAQGEWLDIKAVLIPPNVTHECNAEGELIFSISVDSETLIAENFSLPELHLGEPYLLSDELLLKLDCQKVRKLIESECFDDLKLHVLSFLKCEFQGNNAQPLIDDRIVKVKDYIQSNINSRLSSKELMKVANLSESRLLHLFKAQIGIPVRNYILWHRTRIAFNAINKGENLTQSAYIAGFSDQAHLTRTFIKAIGVPPSLAKNSKFVQVNMIL